MEFSAGVRKALAITPASPARERTVDITTIGRTSGKPRRIEIWFYRAYGVIYLSGLPAVRSWAANLRANPEFIFHLKNGIRADLPAVAVPIDDDNEKRRIFQVFVDDLNQPHNPGRISQPTSVERWLAGSPLFEVRFQYGANE